MVSHLRLGDRSRTRSEGSVTDVADIRHTLGPYQILSPLGAGGMGEVYKATDTRLDRTVAIKVLPEHVASDPDLKQRFEREARTVAALNHPHICTLYDLGTQDGIDFLVMEYLDGQTLAQRLEKGAVVLSSSKRRPSRHVPRQVSATYSPLKSSSGAP